MKRCLNLVARTWRASIHLVLALLFIATPSRAEKKGENPEGAQHLLSAEPLPDVRFEVTVSENASGEPRVLSGKMHIRGWESKLGRCLYLPFEDPDYGLDRGTGRRFEALSPKSARVFFEGGSLDITEGKIQSERAQIARLDGSTGEVELAFIASVPRLPKSDVNQWFFDGFMPELLAKCPDSEKEPEYLRRPMAADYTGQITLPSVSPPWIYDGPGETYGGQVRLKLRSRWIAFALTRGLKHQDLRIEGIPLHLAYETGETEELVSTLRDLMPEMIRMFGPYPFDSLTLIESSELERQGLSGIIAVNRPAQFLFSHLQRNWLNWRHWVAAWQLARQWYGAAIITPSPDDDWLSSGVVEFAAMEALTHSRRFNLFAANEQGKVRFSETYLQISEILAATLRRTSPFAALTDPEWNSLDSVAKQNPLLFAKHASAMRQLKFAAGEAPFFAFLRNLTSRHSWRYLKPADFAGMLTKLPSPFSRGTRDALHQELNAWWTSDEWPDFELLDVTKEELPSGTWITHAKAAQNGKIDFPPLFGVVDESGKEYVSRGEKPPDAPGWQVTLVTEAKPEKVTVDPTHEAFDANRFNNSDGFSGLSLFPGNATTLRDDAYTLVWLPYPFRRPGEPLSLGLQAALFRYVQSGLVAHAETSFAKRLYAYDMSYSYSLPRHALTLSASVSENYDRDQTAEIGLLRSPIFSASQNLSFDLRLRRRERSGTATSEHGTFAVGLGLRPVGVSRYCTYSLLTSWEKAPRSLAHGFTYNRKIGQAAGSCNLSPRVTLAARVFRGAVDAEGEVPDVALFKPQELKEARLRLDRTGVTKSKQILSGNTDFYFPFYFPLPSDTLVLSRQMRWQLFYDVGRDLEQALDLSAAGFGFLIPLGGDVSGAGSLAFTRLTALAILYSRVGSETSRKPSVIFDLTGDL